MRQSVLTMTGSSFFPFAPSLFAQSPVCVCAGGEKEQQQQQQSALALYTPCVLSMCVCVVVCCGWQTERGTNARLCVETVGRAF